MSKSRNIALDFIPLCNALLMLFVHDLQAWLFRAFWLYQAATSTFPFNALLMLFIHVNKNLYYYLYCSFSEESGQTIDGDLTLLAAGYILIIVYVIAAMSKFTMIEHKVRDCTHPTPTHPTQPTPAHTHTMTWHF